KASLSFGDAFLRGILCNVLVCLAVWLAMSATEAAGKIIGLCLPVMLFVLCGFEHSVANMYFIPAGMIAGMLNGADAPGIAGLFHNLIPVTLGNIVGGSVCIGAAFWLLYGKKEA
ncbi:MAG: formate/nitrite transporter family protein, partial [Lachnospiraceae bacterium]|nr:formate/nitrite transporter family protein [Lachnospiraceae bacterium]